MFPFVTGRGQESEFPSAFCLLPSAFPDKFFPSALCPLPFFSHQWGKTRIRGEIYREAVTFTVKLTLVAAPILTVPGLKIISFFNQAGGTSKTTLTQNLGYQLAQRRHRVLLVDIDPQASLTAFMGLEPFELKQTIADSLLKDAPLPIHHNLHGVDLVPSNILLSAAEVQLHSVNPLLKIWSQYNAAKKIYSGSTKAKYG